MYLFKYISPNVFLKPLFVKINARANGFTFNILSGWPCSWKCADNTLPQGWKLRGVSQGPALDPWLWLGELQWPELWQGSVFGQGGWGWWTTMCIKLRGSWMEIEFQDIIHFFCNFLKNVFGEMNLSKCICPNIFVQMYFSKCISKMYLSNCICQNVFFRVFPSHWLNVSKVRSV